MPAEGISKGNDFCNDSAHETHESILFRHFSLFRVFRGLKNQQDIELILQSPGPPAGR